MKQCTILLVTLSLAMMSVAGVFAQDEGGAANQEERIKRLLEENFSVIHNAENIKKPTFTWTEIEEAENYALYVRNEIIYSGPAPLFPPDETYPYEEFAYGYYQAYLLVTLRDGTRIRTDPFDFQIGMPKPELLTLTENELTYQIRPTFKWQRVRGAEGYEVFIDSEMVMDVDAETDTYIPEDPVEFGRHAWYIVAKNQFQRVKSNRGSFQLIRIQPPVLLSPENGYAVTVISEADIPTLQWSVVQPRAEGEITYELYVNGQKVYNGSETRWRPPKMLEPGLYEWYAKAKVYDQVSEPSETWQFTLREKLGMNVGIKAGPNLGRNTNPFSKLRPMFTAGAYADQKIFRKKAFELRAELDALIEMKSVGFDREDNYERQVDDLHINTFNITIPLMIKPMYTIKGITLYMLVGPQISTAVLSRIIRQDTYTETIVEQVERFAVDIIAAFGASYTFDVNYLFGQKLQLSAEFRFNYGFLNTMNDSFLGDAAHLTQYTILIGNKIIDF